MAFYSTALHLDGSERIRASVHGDPNDQHVLLSLPTDRASTAAILTKDDAYASRLAAAINGAGIDRPAGVSASIDGPLATYAALRDLVGAAEESGWDLEPGNDRVLDRGREALAALAMIFAIGDDEALISAEGSAS
jgi:hypothetical protein